MCLVTTSPLCLIFLLSLSSLVSIHYEQEQQNNNYTMGRTVRVFMYCILVSFIGNNQSLHDHDRKESSCLVSMYLFILTWTTATGMFQRNEISCIFVYYTCPLQKLSLCKSLICFIQSLRRENLESSFNLDSFKGKKRASAPLSYYTQFSNEKKCEKVIRIGDWSL